MKKLFCGHNYRLKSMRSENKKKVYRHECIKCGKIKTTKDTILV